jgi:glycosyltransferase involved in cell wall biosynthesis
VAVILDGFVPRYRARLYELLAARSEIEYVVFHGPPPSRNATLAASPPFRFPNREVRNVELSVGGRSVILQRGALSVAREDFQALVMSAQLRFVSSLVLFALFKMRGWPVVLWGQGFDKDEDVGALGGWTLAAKRRAKRAMARWADAYLVYTDGGRACLLDAGLDPERVFVARNTLDLDEQVAIHDRLRDADLVRLRAELGLLPDSVVLLFVGRLYREKRVCDLVEALRAIRSGEMTRHPIEVVVIGDGPELDDLRAEAQDLPGVHFRGEVADQVEVARHMRVATAVVIPGAVGLAANHAFAQGVPLITKKGRFHGPEVEYLEPGVNGLIVDGNTAALAGALAQLCDSPGVQRQLAEGALRSRERLSIDRTAAAFDEAVRTVLGCRGRSGPVRKRSSTQPPREPAAPVARLRAAPTAARGRAG